MRNNVQESERKKEIGRLSSAHKIRRPRDSNEYISYRREICYTLEKRYPGYVYHLPPAHVQQYVPEANQIWQSGSSPSSLVNQPISKGRERAFEQREEQKARTRSGKKEISARVKGEIRFVYFSFRNKPYLLRRNMNVSGVLHVAHASDTFWRVISRTETSGPMD